MGFAIKGMGRLFYWQGNYCSQELISMTAFSPKDIF
jgi:hypothetical protein